MIRALADELECPDVWLFVAFKRGDQADRSIVIGGNFGCRAILIQVNDRTRSSRQDDANFSQASFTKCIGNLQLQRSGRQHFRQLFD